MFVSVSIFLVVVYVFVHSKVGYIHQLSDMVICFKLYETIPECTAFTRFQFEVSHLPHMGGEALHRPVLLKIWAITI